MHSALKNVAIAGLATVLAVPLLAHAQDSQTTTTRETTTITSNGAPPPPAMMQEDRPLPGYSDFGYTVEDYAAHNGYRDGYNKGLSDRNTKHSYRPTEDHIYNDPPGFKGGKYSRDEYKRVYREAFLHGYERGYRQG